MGGPLNGEPRVDVAQLTSCCIGAADSARDYRSDAALPHAAIFDTFGHLVGGN
jgi:hypothetical protein